MDSIQQPAPDRGPINAPVILALVAVAVIAAVILVGGIVFSVLVYL